MKLSKRDDIKRRWKSFLKHLGMLSRAPIPTLIITGTWYFVQKRGLYLPHEDEANLIGTIASLAVVYGLLAAATLLLVADRWPKVTAAVFKKDKEAFLILRDQRIAIVFNMTTGVVAFTLLAVMGITKYHSINTGICCMFSVSLVMSLLYIGIRETQDVTKSQWVRERVQAEWLTESVDKFFFEKQDPDVRKPTPS